LLPPDISDWTDLAELLRPRFEAQYKRPLPDAFIFSHSVPVERLHGITRQLGLGEASPPVAQEHAVPGSLGTQPDPGAAPTAASGLTPCRGAVTRAVTDRGTSELTQVFSGRTVIRTASPVPFRLGTGGWVQVGLSGLRALAAPQLRPVAQLFVDDAWFAGGRLRLKRPATNMYELAVTVPEPPAVLAAALRAAEVTSELSDKGKYARALLDRAPGLEELVSQPGALEVIIDLTRKRTEHFRADLESLLDGKPNGAGLGR
jgi:hypothetical protein